MTGVQITTSYIGQSTFNGLAPTKGPRIVSAALDFSVVPGAKIDVDLTTAQEQDKIEFIQGMYVDNSLNSAPLIVDIRHIGLTETFPPYSQGWLPLPSPNPPKFGFATSTTGVINVILTSFPVPAEVWQVSPIAVPIAGSVGADFSANAPALLANLLATIPVNATRNYFEYQNQSANTHQIVMDNGSGGNQSIVLIAPGVTANSQGGSYTNNYEKGRVRVYSSGATDQFELRQN